MTHRLLAAASSAVLVALVVGCGGDDAPDRSAVVGDLAATVMVPTYDEVASRATSLFDTATALCASTDVDDLADTRDALAATRDAWRRSEAMWVGPVMDRRSWSLVDWPIVAGDIEALLADTTVTPLDAEYLGTRVGAPLRGLGAVEHLLFTGADGRPADGADVATALEDERRCGYLVAVAQVIADETAAVRTSWVDGDDQGVAFQDEVAGTTDRMTATDSIDELVNNMLTRLEGSVNRELGAALGLGTGDTEPDTRGIVEGPGAFGVADQRARAEGMRAVLLGPDGTSGLAPLLSDDLRDRLAAQFDTVDAALAAVDPPLVNAVAADTAGVQAAHDAYAALRVLVSTEVVSELGVTVSFSDADGDSAG